MIEAILALLVISLVVGVGLFVLKAVVALVILPFKLLAWLLGGLVMLVLAVPLLLVFGAMLVALVPVGLVVVALLVLLLPVIVVGALVGGGLGF